MSSNRWLALAGIVLLLIGTLRSTSTRRIELEDIDGVNNGTYTIIGFIKSNGGRPTLSSTEEQVNVYGTPECTGYGRHIVAKQGSEFTLISSSCFANWRKVESKSGSTFTLVDGKSVHQSEVEDQKRVLFEGLFVKL